MSELKRALMHRDKLTSAEADEVIRDMKEQLEQCVDAECMEEVLSDYDLEPDYIFDLI